MKLKVGWQLASSALLVAAFTIFPLLINFFLPLIKPENQYIISAIIITTSACSVILAIVLAIILIKIITTDAIDESIKNAIGMLAKTQDLLDKGRELVLDRERRLFSTWMETDLVEESATEVWILTLDFYWDLNNTQYSQKVKNLITTKQHKYWWLYPKHLKRDADLLKSRLLIDLKDQIEEYTHLSPIDDNIAEHFPHDVIIYDPSAEEEKTIVLICDINGKKRDSPSDSLDMPIRDPILAGRYKQLFYSLAGDNIPPWISNRPAPKQDF